MARILLADDDAATRDLVRRALASDGHDVIVTQDGLEALESLQSDAARINLLISDVDMPGLNGIELAAKAIASAPGIRIVLMTGHSEGAAKTDHLKPHLKRFVSKPFTLDQIKTMVREALA
jgi:DNA-binding NtrC family response regulator